MDAFSIKYRIHALERMFERNISCDELANIIKTGQLVENYPNNIPYPSKLVLGTANNRPLHVVYTFNKDEKSAIVVTVYEPDPRKWESNLVRR
jgi:hypothetical protein